MTIEKRFGDLILTFTDQYELRWNDKGSGAHSDGAYWHPVPPKGFHALGSVGVNNYNDINNKQASICVKAATDDALKPPVSYDLIWADHGSGADRDGSCWRPVPPEGYVALGDVFVNGYDNPSQLDIMCVRKDLTQRAVIGSEIWADHGSGADKDIDTFEVIAPALDVDTKKGFFSVNSIVANNHYSKPTDAPEINCLNLPFPVEELNDPNAPTLNSYNMPPTYSGKTIDRIVAVPFTAICDEAYSLEWKVQNSPFYYVERQIAYHRELFNHNQTSVPQTVSKTVTTGVTETNSETFSRTTGISVTAESGVSFLGTGGKVSATVSVELGWETSRSVAEFKQDSVLKQLVTPVDKASALWAISYTLMVARENNTYLADQMVFDVDSFVESEYPS
ncbi:Vps62-related protein [Pleionea sp. CnH1-48]|uniref:Vps62-related protein n=1 Tax=Pleionea sp. CnH1-48 TaxID=2954494 RepID=UPI002097F2D3|nr:Vps62-related protein [Pleionea sp. CnH1-48]MCO7225150.1 Vps62-related protein [Pleionea sp. CnH1-48]